MHGNLIGVSDSGFVLYDVTNFVLNNNRSFSCNPGYGFEFNDCSYGVIKGNYTWGCGRSMLPTALHNIEFGGNYWDEYMAGGGILGFPTDATRLKFFDRAHTHLCAKDFSVVQFAPTLVNLGVSNANPLVWRFVQLDAIGAYISPPTTLSAGAHSLYVACDFYWVAADDNTVKLDVYGYDTGQSLTLALLYTQSVTRNPAPSLRDQIIFGPFFPNVHGNDLLKLIITYTFARWPLINYMYFISLTLAWD